MIAVLILAETNDFARSIIGERLSQAVPVTPRIRSCRRQRAGKLRRPPSQTWLHCV